jgi:hypothetical protein
MKTLGFDRRGAQKRGNKSVGSEKRAGTLADASDDTVLIRERIATRLEDDLLERRHVSRLCGAADGQDRTTRRARNPVSSTRRGQIREKKYCH